MSASLRVPFVILIILIYLSGCATSPRVPTHNIRLPSRDITTYNNTKTQNSVSIAVEILGEERTKEIFGVNLISKNVQPIYVIIKNNSGDKYWFSKAGSVKDFIPAREVPRRIYEGTYGRFLRGGTLGMVKWPFIMPGAIIDKYKAKKVKNRLGVQEHELDEIPDSHIKPGEEIQGIMFVPVKTIDRLVLKITNSKNLEKQEFVFEE